MRTEAKNEIVKQALKEISTDSNILVIYKGDSYFLCERDNHFYYFQVDSRGIIGVSASCKISPYEKQQCEYFQETTYEKAIDFIKNSIPNYTPFKDAPKQRIFLTELYGMRKTDGKTTLNILKTELAGFREKEILNNLKNVVKIQNDNDYDILRFMSDSGYFDFECKSKRITG